MDSSKLLTIIIIVVAFVISAAPAVLKLIGHGGYHVELPYVLASALLCTTGTIGLAYTSLKDDDKKDSSKEKDNFKPLGITLLSIAQAFFLLLVAYCLFRLKQSAPSTQSYPSMKTVDLRLR